LGPLAEYLEAEWGRQLDTLAALAEAAERAAGRPVPAAGPADARPATTGPANSGDAGEDGAEPTGREANG